MNRTFFLLGQADMENRGETTSVRVEGGSMVTKELVGVVPILPFITSDRTLAAHSRSIVVDQTTKLPPPNPLVHVFNLVGDADSSVNSLHKIQAIINAMQPRRCFNKPVDVFKTSRARLPKTLANIPGCIIPRTETADPKNFSELQAACRKFNEWPLIVRSPGYHGGDNMVMLTDESQIESLRDLAWPYEGICLAQFLDCRDDAGLYQKIRVMMVDGVAYARQCIYSDRWKIHTKSRAHLMDQDIGLRQREEQFLAQLRDRVLKDHAPLFQEIYQRIGLDVFGIDFALVNDQIVVFEANACMHFLGGSDTSSSSYAYTVSYKQALRQALKKMLVRA
ncbi:MAG: hypothetical protein KA135_00130 [Halioglobus sp.]|nr:hypothetical protein [Halioglobus sp.]